MASPMKFLQKFKPIFWDYRPCNSGPFKSLFNFRSLWKRRVLLLVCVALGPLISLAIFNHMVTRHDTEKEIYLRTARLVSNTKRTVSFFLEKRKLALDFVVQHHPFEKITDAEHLKILFSDLNATIGGFTDLGLITTAGDQFRYYGPYDLQGKNYVDEPWFHEVMEKGLYFSEVFRGFRDTPHLVIAIKYKLNDTFYIFRATIDTKRFNQLISEVELIGNGDAFLINHQGILQTSTRSHGLALESIKLPIPEYSEHTAVFEVDDVDGERYVIGYAYLPDTPFILMITEQKSVLMAPWLKTQIVIISFVAFGVIGILLAIYFVATHLVTQIFVADQKRVQTLHEVEHTSRLASIGRLAAGVAHEINNPLAIINEKAGLTKDILTYGQQTDQTTKLISQIDSILASVERCGNITKRLLGFARHLEVNIIKVNIEAIIEDVLGFLTKEAEYRSIQVTVKVDENIPEIETDRGKMQQVFLNLINNAFAAMQDGGSLDIRVRRRVQNKITITVTDDGSGIPEADLKRIYEPFFSTKTKKGGTGLGLSITYGLVQELGGTMDVQSVVGVGTQFIINLPLTQENKD